jgi:hypothetical protein
VPPGGALGKEFFLKKVNFFVECLQAGHSAKSFLKKNSLLKAAGYGTQERNSEKNI